MLPRLPTRLRATDPHDGLACALLAGLAVLVAWTAGDYGLSWDEPYHATYGELVLDFWASGFADRRALDYRDLYLYGGLFDAITAWATGLAPDQPLYARRLMTALAGLVGIAGTWRFARWLAGPAAAFWAAFLLAATPSWYGHMLINPKDVPFAAATIWTLYAMARLIAARPRVPVRAALWFGLALGCALGIRAGGAIMLGYLAILMVADGLARASWRTGRQAVRNDLGDAARAGLIGLGVAYGVMLVLWPWALMHPLTGPLDALFRAGREAWDGAVLLAGARVRFADMPWTYLPLYLAAKLPVGLIAAAGLGLFFAARHLIMAKPDRRAIIGWTVILLGLFAPMLYIVSSRVILYDGIRHALFVVPPIACLGGIGAAGLVTAGRSHGRAWAWLAGVLVAGMIGWTSISAVKLHPYQYVYYNELVGGVDGAVDRYELDYWATSYREATVGLVAHASTAMAAGQLSMDQLPLKLFVCGPSLSAMVFLNPDDFVLADAAAEADYMIGFTRDNCDRSVDGDIVAAVSRQGATLSVVKALWTRRATGSD